jgi:hypothetical protein
MKVTNKELDDLVFMLDCVSKNVSTSVVHGWINGQLNRCLRHDSTRARWWTRELCTGNKDTITAAAFDATSHLELVG